MTLLFSASLAFIGGLLTSKPFAVTVSDAFSSVMNISTVVGDLTVENSYLIANNFSLTAVNSGLTIENKSEVVLLFRPVSSYFKV